MLDQSYSKTEAGRTEIKSRALVTARVARNLLLVIDGSKTGRQWLGLVQGASEADLLLLLQQGLVAPVGVAAPTAPASTAATPSSKALPDGWAAATSGAGAALSKEERLLAAFGATPALDAEALAAYLNSHANKLLGLMKGYVFGMEVEQCRSLPELQELALSFVERVEQAKGAEAAAQLRRELGLREA